MKIHILSCPNCGSSIDEKARFCPQCGTKVVIQKFDEKLGVVHHEKVNYCPICGLSPNPRDTFRCSICEREYVCLNHLKKDTWSYGARIVCITPRCVDCYNKEYKSKRPQIREIAGLYLGKLIEVPDLIGLTKNRAKEKLKHLGLRFSIRSEEYSSKHNKGEILRQSPEPGKVIDSGGVIEFVLARSGFDSPFKSRITIVVVAVILVSFILILLFR